MGVQEAWCTSMILAIDLAVRCSGWALFDGDLVEYGMLKLPSLPKDATNRQKAERDWQFWEKAEGIIPTQSWLNLDTVIIEFPHRWMRAAGRTSTATLDSMTGVKHIFMLVVIAMSEAEIEMVDPRDWKKPLNIKSKDDAIAKVKELYDLETTHDEADAICVGVWWKGK